MNSTIIILSVIIGLFHYGISAPVGPDFNNIQYLHNFSLTYSNGTLHGMDSINNYPDVDATMNQNLRDAINRALPGYLSSSSSTSSSSSSASSTGFPATSTGSTTQTGAPLDLITPINTGSTSTATTQPSSTITQAVGRRKRAADATSTSTTSSSSASSSSVSTPSSTQSFTPSPSTPPVLLADSPISSTQPYGTDEEFYARTDLVHFHVDINVPEGSGDKPFPMPGFN